MPSVEPTSFSGRLKIKTANYGPIQSSIEREDCVHCPIFVGTFSSANVRNGSKADITNPDDNRLHKQPAVCSGQTVVILAFLLFFI